jgi:lysophospholipase L1-like esterase
MPEKKTYGVGVVAVTLAAAVGIGLVLCELLLRLLYPQTLGVWTQTRDGLILLRTDLHVYLEKFGTHVQTNVHGFRDREHALQKRDGALRILLLGDSFMEALQVEFADAFPSLLERDLHSLLGCEVEVINAGVSGWGTDDEVTYLTRKGKQFHPDVVLFAATLHNDVSDNLEERYHVADRGQLVAKPIHELPWYAFWGLETRSYLASHSHLYQIAYQSWKSLGRSGAGARLTSHVIELMRNDPKPEVVRGWWVTQMLLEKANSVAKSEGFSLAMFMIPTIYEVDDRAYSNLIATQRLNDTNFNREKPVETLAAILKQAGIQAIDLLPEFRVWSRSTGRPLYLDGDGHFNAEGHRLAASIVSKQLTEMIRKQDRVRQCLLQVSGVASGPGTTR